MPNLHSIAIKQDKLAPWENALEQTNRISIYRYPKGEIKWINLSKAELESIGFADSEAGKYVFLKLRLTKIDVTGKGNNEEIVRKKYDVIYGPYWFDNDDYTVQNLKNFANRGNSEFHIFCVSKKDYDIKLADNSIIKHIPTHFMENLNAILCNDDKDDSNGYYMFYYIDFVSTLYADINQVFEAKDSAIAKKIINNTNKKVKLTQTEANLLKYGVYRKQKANLNRLDNGQDPLVDFPGTTVSPATTACGWRVPKA